MALRLAFFYIVTGSFGILAGRTKRTSYIITFMVLSIVAASAILVFAVSVAANGLFMDVYSCTSRYGPYPTPPSQGKCRVWYALNGLLLCLFILASVVGVISAGITCGPLCPGGATSRVVVLQAPSDGQHQHLVPGEALSVHPGQLTTLTVQSDTQDGAQAIADTNPLIH